MHRFLVVCAVVFLAGTPSGCSGPNNQGENDAETPAEKGSAQHPEFAQGSIETVTIKLDASKRVSTRDPEKIETLLAALRHAQATNDHKCGDSGQIVLRKKRGDEVKLGILAGHNQRYYEFRLYRGTSYDIYRVERKPFLKGMEDLGLTELDPGFPE
jgi:hypothetical protein